MTKHVPLAERRKPGLVDTLPVGRAPNECRACGAPNSADNPLSRWLECDEWDKLPPKPVCIVVCERCRRQHVEPHPRLYVELARGAAWPGAMGVCVDCRSRQGQTCTSTAKLEFAWKEEPERLFAIVCTRGARGGRRSGLLTQYNGPVIRCSDFTPTAEQGES